MKYPQSIQNLINSFSELPTVGPKTAERYVFYLLNQNNKKLSEFGNNIIKLKRKINICPQCNVVSDEGLCSICKDKNRDKSILCIVENTRNLISIEATKQYNGIYYVLGTLINTIKQEKPSQKKLKFLIKKIQETKIKEVILAFNANIEGETTSLYLAKLLKNYNLKISKLARGLPMGSDLEYADDITISNALKYRINI